MHRPKQGSPALKIHTARGEWGKGQRSTNPVKRVSTADEKTTKGVRGRSKGKIVERGSGEAARSRGREEVPFKEASATINRARDPQAKGGKVEKPIHYRGRERDTANSGGRTDELGGENTPLKVHCWDGTPSTPRSHPGGRRPSTPKRGEKMIKPVMFIAGG